MEEERGLCPGNAPSLQWETDNDRRLDSECEFPWAGTGNRPSRMCDRTACLWRCSPEAWPRGAWMLPRGGHRPVAGKGCQSQGGSISPPGTHSLSCCPPGLLGAACRQEKAGALETEAARPLTEGPQALSAPCLHLLGEPVADLPEADQAVWCLGAKRKR